jgi:hypothetical protein
MSHTKRRTRWRRERGALIAFAVGMLALAGAYFGPAFRTVSEFRSTSASVALRSFAPPSGRPVYPYSVIRGGAYSAEELVRALDADPVAARHYAVFRRSRVHTTESRFSSRVYLSYRVGDVVYWTRRAVPLPHGETLLTDGENYARARCGNRISEIPQTPVSETEPAPSTLDQPKPPADVPTPKLEAWDETRLVSELSPPFVQLSPANTLPAHAVSGAIPMPLSGSTSYWSIGPPTGFLYVEEVASQLAPKLPIPITGNTGGVIQPNPIQGFVFPIVPVELALAPPVFDTLPPSLLPGYGFPPTYETTGSQFPSSPNSDVPEPGLLTPTVFAVLVALAYRANRRRGTSGE